jgi:hypothetical protein
VLLSRNAMVNPRKNGAMPACRAPANVRLSVPDLAAAEQKHRYVVEVPPVLDRDEWQRKYGHNPSLPPPSLQ